MAQLTAVEGNPFEDTGPKLTPVEGNPFAEPEQPQVPDSFLHRVALGMMIGGSNPSPAELRAKGLEDFDVATNTVNQFKAGLDRIKKGFQDTHSSYDIAAGAFQSLTSPASAVFQAIGGAGEKATGGILTGDQINTALIMADGVPGRFSRVREGAEQVIGGLPTPRDFSAAANVMESPHAEANLQRMWQEDGIHPAEAVHDAQADAFVKHEITAPQETISASVEPSVSRHQSATEQFRQQVEDHYNELPQWIRNALGNAGYGISAVDRLSSALPELSDRAPRGYGDKSKLDMAQGIYLPFRKQIFVAKQVLDRKTLVPTDAENVSAALVHEVGHALDSHLNITMSDEYRAAYERDVADLKGNERGLEYLLQPGQAGKEETFAEIFAHLVGKEGGPGKDPVGYFPNTAKLILDKLESSSNPIPRDWDVRPDEMEQAFGPNASLSAAITPPADIPLDATPARPAGSLIASAQAASDKLFDIGRDIQMKLAPMARGSVESMATVKDYMNTMRRNAWDSSRIDTNIVNNFSAERRERMARAMEEESLSLRLGEPESAREHQGLATLEPNERAAVLQLDAAQQAAWLRARDLGMVEGDGIPMHFPRMAIGAKGDSEIGKPPSLTQMYGIRKNSPFTKQRQYMEAEETEKALKAKYGDQAKIAWDIRAVNLATKTLEDAVAGRTLIKNIEEVGKRTGEETVAEGWKPGDGWFTVDHPAFQKWRVKLGEDGAVKDAEGNPQFEQVPIYVRGDFEGPIRAALWGKSGQAYQAMMALKGKTMGLIMNSPAIHNMVELGRAFPAMPTRIFKAYFDGYRAKNDPAVMHEAIDAGLVPIGKRFFNQDINAIMEAPDLTPGRSFTAKVLSAVPGLFDEAAGTAVKRAIDKAGDFWHNTLLWDRVGDLQAGLYVNFRGDMIAKGMDPQTASRLAAHWANRYAGALPKEAMSEGATKVANFMMFSRSFTLGNLGVMKDMLTGLPKDVLAQIERDAGFKAGSIAEADKEGAVQQAVTSAKSMARRKAISVVLMDIGLMYVGNSVLQSALNVMRGDHTLTQEGHDYLTRMQALINDEAAHPLQMLNPFHIASIPGRLSSTSENEPGRKDRILIGYSKDGTAIYARNPVGKIGEEFANWFGSPLDMLKKKEGTFMRPLMQIISNDAGFGRKVYDPDADTASRYAGNIWAIIKHIAGSQLPVGQLGAAHDLITGEGDKFVNQMQAFGPFAGVTFAKGAPGGPAVGEMYSARSQHEFQVNQALPDIRRQIQRGDIAGAQQRMVDLGIPAGLQRWYVKTTINPALRMSPRAVKDFYTYATPEQRAMFDRDRARVGQ